MNTSKYSKYIFIQTANNKNSISEAEASSKWTQTQAAKTLLQIIGQQRTRIRRVEPVSADHISSFSSLAPFLVPSFLILYCSFHYESDCLMCNIILYDPLNTYLGLER